MAETSMLPPDPARNVALDLKSGLSQQEAERRLATFGPNVIPKARSNLFRIYVAPLLNWLVNIYLIITAILAVFAFFILPNIWGQVAFWFVFIGVNAVVAIVQQARAQKNLEALQRMSPGKSKVVRDGQVKEIPSEQVVPGDVIKLEQGDRVPADARIIASSSLRVNEAPLTGESNEVEKSETAIPVDKNAPISDRKDTIFKGTYVAAGTAHAIVLETGSKTQFGRISEDVRQLDTGEIPLRKKVNKIAKYLALAVLFYLAVSLSHRVISLYLDGSLFNEGSLNVHIIAEAAVRSLITSMSIMPINIPLLTTIILLAGVLAMAGHQVVIRDLGAVESLGRVSVVSSDKTGTITRNEMTVRWVCLPGVQRRDQVYGVTGVGFGPDGKVIAVEPASGWQEIISKEALPVHTDRVSIGPRTSLEYLLVSGMLNNDSTINTTTTGSAAKHGGHQTIYQAVGDTTDAAILTLFRKSALDEGAYRSNFQEVRSYPFDSTMKRMTKLFRDGKTGKYVAFTKGATEVLMPRCELMAVNTVDEREVLNERARAIITQKASFFASCGYRVISLAFKPLDEPSKVDMARDSVENGLIYLGFVAIIDPPRDDVAESVAELKSAGIRPIMITGDGLETAKSVAVQVGITGKDDLTVAACDMNELSDEQFLKTSVFARVSPEDKMTIVKRYKELDRAVAATGDGVNDAAAISMADVGIAMGITGTDVAKQAADMVIADDSFHSLVVGIREGRGIFEKIRSVIFFYIAVNLAEALLYFGTSFISGFVLLNTWQKVFIFTTVHAIPPLALITDRLNREVMKQKPRDTQEIFNRQMIVAMALFSISLALVLYAAYFATAAGVLPVFQGNLSGYVPNFLPGVFNVTSWSEAKARTLLLTVGIIGEILLIISLRRLNKPILRTLREDHHWTFWPLLLIVPLAYLVLMYVPQTQLFLVHSLGINFEIIRLTGVDWIAAITLGVVPVTLLEIYKMWVRRKGEFF